QKITLLEQILQRNSGIREAIIVHDQAKGATFQRKEVHTALVTLWATEGNVIENLQATTARQVVVNAFAGMQEEDVTVVDGDTGMSFHPRDNSRMDQLIAKNQLDLETARQQYTNQFRRLLYEFGSCEIDVRMNLEKRSHVVQRIPQEGGADEKADLPQVEVVANGKGKIRPKGAPAAGIEKRTPEFATVLIKRLIGIEVTLQQGDVEDYLKKQMGLKTGTSEEQYSRGVVNIRNEITKKIISWIRSQGIEVGPDIVSVTVLSAAVETREPAAKTESAYTAVQVSLIGGGLLLLVMVGVLVTAGFKSRSPVIHSSTQQFSGAGREFVNRNQATTGSLLVDEVNEVVQSAPGPSAQAFQNLVTGEGNR
ncbi:MAG: hypothetical protein VX768_12890, partial [Planctomycetota bacterium]|nr:hypothetical protein [Planctomycetota bacterium]